MEKFSRLSNEFVIFLKVFLLPKESCCFLQTWQFIFGGEVSFFKNIIFCCSTQAPGVFLGIRTLHALEYTFRANFFSK